MSIRNRIGRARGYGGCYRCGITWDQVDGHDTPYATGQACFPLCEACWSALTPETRLPYYARLMGQWLSAETNNFPGWEEYIVQSADKWPLIKTAVLAGR